MTLPTCLPRLRLLSLLLSASLLFQSSPARAQVPAPSPGQAVAIFAVLGAVGAGIGIGVYYLARAPRNLTGCVFSTPAGPQLNSEYDRQNYVLLGDTAGIKPGNRLRLAGKRQKRSALDPEFVVTGLAKDFGPCQKAPRGH